ncbi:hypothetical protein [Dyella sp. C11]|uniref:hypothetical protein n=1 Tax=Dyella sp. C11 TaxID=2126991 RepID=UPI001300A921|nr:hypothetical protein [Dyella sp. C11]
MRTFRTAMLVAALSCSPGVLAGTRVDLTLPTLIDRLLATGTVVPTTPARVFQVTGIRFPSPGPDGRSWSSDALELADGVQVNHVELRVYAHQDPSIGSIHISLDTKHCVAPDALVSRYALTGFHGEPAPAPPAAGYALSSEPIPFRYAKYRRMPWGLFAAGIEGYSERLGLPTCVTGITLRQVSADEDAMWRE